MFIAQNHSAYNSAWRGIVNIPQLVGNIVPNHWYYQLLRPCGKSDTTAITLLSEPPVPIQSCTQSVTSVSD